MSRVFILALLPLFFFTLYDQSHSQDDWRRWRGPNGNGVAEKMQSPPVTWDENQHVVWKSKVPGRGHASPIIVDGKIFLTTADEEHETQSVLCYDRETGQQLWQTQINRLGFNPRIHAKNTHASSTVATDGDHVFAVFNNHERFHLVSLDFDGNQIWERNVGRFDSKFPFGFGASPIVHAGNVIVTNQNDTESSIVAFDAGTSVEQWRINCPKRTSYSTPVVTEISGKHQMLLSGLEAVTSYDPTTGKQLWKMPAQWDVTCGTVVWDGDLVFASGGFPPQQTVAVKADGRGKLVWENGIKCYEQSMLAIDGYVYAHSESGVIYCWRGEDGKEMWKQRFSTNRVAQSASPVYANGNIYFSGENGLTRVIKSNPKELEEVARNKLGDEAFASMAICGNQIFTRVAHLDSADGSRQEWLYCLGE